MFWKGITMELSFVAERITQLRMEKNVSEHRMSLDLNMGHGYIHNITSGNALPSMEAFFRICDYFGITPQEFFNTTSSNSQLVCEAEREIRRLDRRDLRAFVYLLRRFNENRPDRQ